MVPKSVIIVLLLYAFNSRADIPAAAVPILPVLQQEIHDHWLEFDQPAIIAGQIEQETCYSDLDRRCWNPHAELITKAEHGIGLGQLTISYDAQGRERFNNFELAKRLHPSLAVWSWADRYDPKLQLRALIIINHNNEHALGAGPVGLERTAMWLAAYNGGMGGLQRDRRLCASTPDCNSNTWFCHVERVSYKSKTATASLSTSAFEINRKYPKNILSIRAPRYLPYFSSHAF